MYAAQGRFSFVFSETYKMFIVSRFIIAKINSYTHRQGNGLPMVFSYNRTIHSNKNEQVISTPPTKKRMNLGHIILTRKHKSQKTMHNRYF